MRHAPNPRFPRWLGDTGGCPSSTDACKASLAFCRSCKRSASIGSSIRRASTDAEPQGDVAMLGEFARSLARSLGTRPSASSSFSSAPVGASGASSQSNSLIEVRSASLASQAIGTVHESMSGVRHKKEPKLKLMAPVAKCRHRRTHASIASARCLRCRGTSRSSALAVLRSGLATSSTGVAYLSLALMTCSRRFSFANGPAGFFSWVLP